MAVAAISLVFAACADGDGTATAPPVTARGEAPSAQPSPTATAQAAIASPSSNGTFPPGNGPAEAFAKAFAGVAPLDDSVFDATDLAGADAVIWFWAPWCTSCRREAPDVAEVARRYADEVTFVGVAGRGELDAMRQFVADTDTAAFTHVADVDGTVWSTFGVYGQPAFAFLDGNGAVEVVVAGLGVDALTERIDALLSS